MKYKETPITGTAWERSYQVTINNPLNGVPSITFKKERVSELSDGTLTNTPIGETQAAFTTPEAEFDIVHPDTGEVIGKSTHQQVYLMLHGLFLALDKG